MSGCIERLRTLRLLIDYARKTKKVLYVVFVDYEKAYDGVSRSTLLNMLAQIGCGALFLSAITKTLKFTRSVIGDSFLDVTAVVQQDVSTSCSLFTFYIACYIAYYFWMIQSSLLL